MTDYAVDVFPDVELALIGVLAPEYDDYRFVTRMPAQVTKTTVRINRISGANRSIRIDRPIVDIDVFAADVATASSAARNIQSALLSLRGSDVTNGVIQSVSTINGPRELPEANPDIVRYAATYEILIHA